MKKLFHWFLKRNPQTEPDTPVIPEVTPVERNIPARKLIEFAASQAAASACLQSMSWMESKNTKLEEGQIPIWLLDFDATLVAWQDKTSESIKKQLEETEKQDESKKSKAPEISLEIWAGMMRSHPLCCSISNSVTGIALQLSNYVRMQKDWNALKHNPVWRKQCVPTIFLASLYLWAIRHHPTDLLTGMAHLQCNLWLKQICLPHLSHLFDTNEDIGCAATNPEEIELQSCMNIRLGQWIIENPVLANERYRQALDMESKLTEPDIICFLDEKTRDKHFDIPLGVFLPGLALVAQEMALAEGFNGKIEDWQINWSENPFQEEHLRKTWDTLLSTSKIPSEEDLRSAHLLANWLSDKELQNMQHIKAIKEKKLNETVPVRAIQSHPAKSHLLAFACHEWLVCDEFKHQPGKFALRIANYAAWLSFSGLETKSKMDKQQTKK